MHFNMNNNVLRNEQSGPGTLFARAETQVLPQAIAIATRGWIMPELGPKVAA